MRLFSLFTLLCLLTLSANAEVLQGRVVAVADGDTLTLLDAQNTQHKIRLNGIDAPELGQDFGQAAKQNLAGLSFDKSVVVIWSKRDKYSRIIGTVVSGALDLSLVQIRDGFAWYYREYEADVPPVERVLYDAAEQNAKFQLRGLWKQSGAQPPWTYRHANTVAAKPIAVPAARLMPSPTPVPQRTPEQQPAPRSHASSGSYIRGLRGGCYYINGNGNKTYVSRSLCN